MATYPLSALSSGAGLWRWRARGSSTRPGACRLCRPAGSALGAGSQSSTGFNFTANANTSVPGVFQFGASSTPANPPGASSTFSFGTAIANAPSFGTIPPAGQPGAPPGGNMFSIGTSGSSANTKGRTIRTATRRRPK